MTEAIEQVEATEEITPEAAQESIQKGYDQIASPEKFEEASKTEETPPGLFSSEQTQELMTQVARIPELEKRLRDEGGRYGALKQSIEQLQQRIAESATRTDVSNAEVDVEDLLADVKESFGEDELYGSLKSAFTKALKGRGGSIDPAQVDRLVSERLTARDTEVQSQAAEQLAEWHPDYQEVTSADTYAEWIATLPVHKQARIQTSYDPHFAAEMLDQHKEWLKSRTNKQEAPNPSRRLAAAVLPTNGTKNPPKAEPSAKESIRAGYERVAGTRL